MKRSPLKKRNKLIQMYNAKLKHVPYCAYKIDHPLLHILYDQYHQVMKMLNNEKIEEDILIAEYNYRTSPKTPIDDKTE